MKVKERKVLTEKVNEESKWQSVSNESLRKEGIGKG
jgi:hypothetical protein